MKPMVYVFPFGVVFDIATPQADRFERLLFLVVERRRMGKVNTSLHADWAGMQCLAGPQFYPLKCNRKRRARKSDSKSWIRYFIGYGV